VASLVKTLPRSTPEQRSRFYDDIETLISVGFLSHTITIHGIPLSLRSLGPGDSFLLQARIGAESTVGDFQTWAIASSIWMVNGYCLLGELHSVPRVVQTIKGLPQLAREILFSLVMGLFTRQNKAIKGIEAYCYEGVSRFKWKSYGRGLPTSHSGIPGVEKLGTNHIQRMWMFYNEVEDQRIADETMWEGFKLSASAMSPKGVKKIDDRDRQHRIDEEKRKQTVQDKFYYACLGLFSEDESKKEKKTALLNAAKSVEDLENEMYLWVTGQEDWHDKIVNDYKRQISERYMKEKAEREARAEMLRQRMEETSLGQSTALVGYTPEQLSEILKQRQPGASGARQVYDDPYGGVREYLYKRHLEKAPDAGLLKAVEGRVDVKEGVNITQQISDRQVAFSTENEEQ
jgi:hypothetical protein